MSAATHLQLGKPDVDQPCPHPAPGRASLPCSGDQGDAAESSAEAGAPRRSGGRRTRDLPHLPMRRHGGELMRSKVRGRRRADNLLAPQAAGGVQAAEGRHLPPRAPQHLQPHNEVITGPLLDGRHQHLSLLHPPNSHLWLRERRVREEGTTLPSRLGLAQGFGGEGGLVLTLFVEEMLLLRSLPVHPLYYLLKVSGPLQPGLTGGKSQR